jgi:putative tricarboxylic transport membrane protein
MLESAIAALGHLASPLTFLALTGGVLIGMISGAMPGGGVPGLVILLGFAYHMDPWIAIPLAIGMWSTVPTTDTIPAVLLGIPGSTSGQATILDGHAMARKGQAGVALAAAYFGSLVGGLLGAIFLVLTLPIARPLVNQFGSAEFFIMGLVTIAVVGVLSSGAVYKGLAAGALGLLISTIGFDTINGIPRATFGQSFLYDGIPLVPMIVGLFAIPELIDLVINDTPIARQRFENLLADTNKGRREGIMAVVHNWGVVVQSTIIGIIIGVMPGIGGSLANWLTYAQARQSVKDGIRTFGTGDVRGVIAPETANNAVDGGDLLPTLGFGVPGSVGMALFMGFLIILGYQPGPPMINNNMDVLLGIAFSLAIANVMATGLGLLFTPQIARVALVRPNVLVPIVLAVLMLSAFQASASMWDLILVLIAAALGFFMKTYGWPRPPIIIAIVMGDLIEKYYFLAATNYGWTLFLRPAVIVMLVFTAGMVIYTLRLQRQAKLAGAVVGGDDD